MKVRGETGKLSRYNGRDQALVSMLATTDFFFVSANGPESCICFVSLLKLATFTWCLDVALCVFCAHEGLDRF